MCRALWYFIWHYAADSVQAEPVSYVQRGRLLNDSRVRYRYVRLHAAHGHGARNVRLDCIAVARLANHLLRYLLLR